MQENVDFVWELDWSVFLSWTEEERYDEACKEYFQRFNKNKFTKVFGLISDIQYYIEDSNSDEQTIAIRVVGFIEVIDDDDDNED